MNKNDGWLVGCLVAMFIALIPLGIIFKMVIYPMFVADKAVDTVYEITNRTLNADNVIYNYEWFKTQYEAIESQKANLAITVMEYDSFEETLSDNSQDWSNFQQQEEASLRSSLSASKKILNQLISDYNAKSKMVNRSIFKNNVPAAIELVE